ncbi:MAG TPA: PhzF family phenazine biosynthesis protein [Vicinamibacterales bacterium]|jgi:trans-2,3-dihydro-3-hydroxyanthranilate isomerase|nr:PhzF family phenazine biosynthesis protein [Vicinamibacterales bacterium]
MARTFLQYDVFTREPLAGNQLAVFTDARGLDTQAMQRIAREMNFSESTFILPVEWAGTDIRMRIFTPMTEMPAAGHPTIGSTFALAATGVITPAMKRFVFHLNIGPTPVDLEWDGDRLSFAWMTQANPSFGPTFDDRELVASTIGLNVDDLLPGAPARQMSCGAPFLLVALNDAAAVDRAVSDAGAFKRFTKAAGVSLPIFLFALNGRGADAGIAVYSRMFAPEFGITEDPATGIASGPLGCYLLKHGLVTAEQARAIVSDQGVAMGRASRIHISIASEAGVITDVKVGGEAVLVARGELLV